MRPARSILITAAALVIAVVAAAEPLRIATLAGSSAGGGYVDGTRTAARFSGPQSLAVANDGTVYVADTRNHVIRAIAPDGFVSTVAGIAGERGSNDGAGREARFNFPAGIAVDANGTIYVADTNNHTIRKIVAGVVTTLAGSAGVSGTADGNGAAARFTFPVGIGVALDGTIYVADTNNHAIRKITPDGSVTTLAGVKRALGYNDGFGTQASFRYPFDLAVAPDGTIYVADTSNELIRKVTPEGRVTTVAGAAQTTGTTDGTGNAARFDHPWGIAVDGSGNVYVADAENEMIRKIRPDGTVSTLAGFAARFVHPNDVAVDAAGNVLVADRDNEAIRIVSPAGVTTTFAGSMPEYGNGDGPGSLARFFFPDSVASDSLGNIYVADGNHTIRKITPQGVVTTFAGQAGQRGSADGTGSVARFYNPSGVAVDANDNVYVADTNNHTIRKITPSRVVTTIAGLAGSSGYEDGTGSQARFQYPWDVAVDSRGNVYVADTYNHKIRMIEPSGVVTTFAGGSLGSSDGIGRTATFNYPTGIAVDAARNLYIADWGNSSIRRITQAGAVTTIAGKSGSSGSDDGTGSAARFDHPNDVAAKPDGTLYVADTDNHTIREVTPLGLVTTIAGLAGTSGNVDGVGPTARFLFPNGIAIDPGGRIVVADTYNHAIRVGFAPQPRRRAVGH